MALKDKQTTITFHAGILTIGGTVIEVAYQDSHIYFDFGTEFRPELTLPDETLPTLIQHRLAPSLDFIYDPSLGYQNQQSENSFNHTAVFISHCHLDHTRMINYLDAKIPLYALKETKILLEALNKDNQFLLPLANPQSGYTRDIIGLDHGAVVRIGDISVKTYRVDHDAYGAMGMTITTPDLTITYTGDLRFHGFNGEDTEAFCLANQNTDVLIMEGVSVSFDDQPKNPGFSSEAELMSAIVDKVNQFSNQATTFNVYPANLLRIKKLVETSPRTVVLHAELAAIMKAVFQMDIPFYSKNSINYHLNDSFKIDYDILKLDRGKYFWQIVEHFEDIAPQGLYIHSDAAPLGDFDPAYQPFVQQFAKRDVEFNRMTCSGHALPKDLDRVIRLIQPKLLVPIHTLKPEKLVNPYGERHLPQRGEKL